MASLRGHLPAWHRLLAPGKQMPIMHACALLLLRPSRDLTNSVGGPPWLTSSAGDAPPHHQLNIPKLHSRSRWQL